MPAASVTAPAAEHAEYQQVTVLFGDVVHSMDIAVAVGAERLREIMTELVEHSAAVVRRNGGTVDEWGRGDDMTMTGDPLTGRDGEMDLLHRALSGVVIQPAKVAPSLLEPRE